MFYILLFLAHNQTTDGREVVGNEIRRVREDEGGEEEG